MLVTHPLPPPVAMGVDQQRKAAALGAMLEYPVGATLDTNPTWDISEGEKFDAYVSAIRAIGPESIVVTSDLGQSMNPLHTDGLAVFLGKLAKAGFSEAELDLMVRRNPAWLLGL